MYALLTLDPIRSAEEIGFSYCDHSDHFSVNLATNKLSIELCGCLLKDCCYRPQREGNVFTSVSLFTGGGVRISMVCGVIPKGIGY